MNAMGLIAFVSTFLFMDGCSSTSREVSNDYPITPVDFTHVKLHDGEFEFGWMDRIIDKFHVAGIAVILGTPTYSIPAWLWHKHPEVLLDRRDGDEASYGIRQNMNITNPTYLFYSERIIRKMIERFASHPAIIGFQVDNETEARGVNNYDFQVSFVNHLKKKYKTPENLNKVWGLNYWGMTIDSWEEVPLAKSGVNEDENGVHFFYNYSSEPINFVYPHSSGKELVSGKSVAKGESMTIDPWDVIIIEE